MYKAYLQEPIVRAAHDEVLAIAKLNSNFDSVVDFGCGQFNEFAVHGKPGSYLGVDINAEPEETPFDVITADYRKAGNLLTLIGSRDLVGINSPTAFVSLFSTEITAPVEENYTFYERIFSEIPAIQSGLVAGFFYESKMDQNPVEEAGGIQSYQTLEAEEDVLSDVFSEKRIVLPVPSMFGSDVIEVWKFFERR
jgi:hypothetical protein